jgi:hypothetical protein
MSHTRTNISSITSLPTPHPSLDPPPVLPLQITAGLFTSIFNIHSNNPFSTWGETLTILLQNFVLVFLIWEYSTPPTALANRLLAITSIASLGVAAYSLPVSHDADVVMMMKVM